MLSHFSLQPLHQGWAEHQPRKQAQALGHSKAAGGNWGIRGWGEPQITAEHNWDAVWYSELLLLVGTW